MKHELDTKKIGEFLEKHRASKGVSLYQISKDLMINRSSVGRVFSGKSCPGAILFLQLVVYLEIPASSVQDFIIDMIFF